MGAVSAKRKSDKKLNSPNGASTKIAVVNNVGTTASSNVVKPDALVAVVPQWRLQGILQTIESETPRKIHDLAREFNLSQSHLQHLFKQQTGLCLGHLLTGQRLERAAYLLAHTHLRIKEIAYAVGYEHTSSFIRAFERRFTHSPLVYRKRSHGAAQRKLTKSRAS